MCGGNLATPGGDRQELSQVRIMTFSFILKAAPSCINSLSLLPLLISYEFVKYLRQYVESTLGAVIEEETESCAKGDGHAIGSGQDTLVHAVTRRTRESPQCVAYSYSILAC